MPEGEGQQGQGQQQPPATPPASPPTNPTPPPADGGEGGDESVDGLKRALRAERDQRRAYEKQVRELGQWKQQQEDRDKTEAQKAADKIAQYERERAQWETERRALALERAIATANRTPQGQIVVDEEAALKLIDRDAIEYDEQGRPKNLAKLLRDLVQERPYLAAARRPGSADGGAGGPPAATADMNTLLRRAAGRA